MLLWPPLKFGMVPTPSQRASLLLASRKGCGWSAHAKSQLEVLCGFWGHGTTTWTGCTSQRHAATSAMHRYSFWQAPRDQNPPQKWEVSFSCYKSCIFLPRGALSRHTAGGDKWVQFDQPLPCSARGRANNCIYCRMTPADDDAGQARLAWKGS